MDLLPDDLLADVFRRLAPCGLAASRCVRKAWCAIIDTRRLLRADLLPLRLDGFFCLGRILHPPPCFFSRRPSPGRQQVAGGLDFLGTRDAMDLHIIDHCNSLLLLDFGRLVNPATRQWARLPSSPHQSTGMEDFYDNYGLVYDPMVSPHYAMSLIPTVPARLGSSSMFQEDSEWPPSPYSTHGHVFSSRSWRWEERSFVLEGGVAVATIADMMLPDRQNFERHTVYLRGALYVHCQDDSVMRHPFSSSSSILIYFSLARLSSFYYYLRKSEKGVYCTLLWNDRWPHCRVWLLNESCDQTEWALKSNISLQAVVQNYPFSVQNRYSKPWIVINNNVDMKEPRAEEHFEWNFEDGAILETKDSVETYDQETFFSRISSLQRDCVLLSITSKSSILSFEQLQGSRVGHLI
ncbi:hypothetical protein PVAP13_3KG127430 [Panicum virgatum]|uniref:F-box domain-containing protein n=1 Tax=Panicum virgatum TaxID=38727 RepID=A0A8T0UZ51_PANVG|nr:hypothetical protein PVAP13_3KG127430 [Panicum virgatum]